MSDIKRILCPVDLSEAAAHAAEHAVALAGWYKARITALHVYNPLFMPVPGLPLPEDRVIPAVEMQLVQGETAQCFRRATEAGIGLDVVIDVGQAVPEILARATSLPADLIVMGTHGASGFEHLMLGSVTEKVLRKSPCPVMTVPPRARTTSTLPFKRLLCAVDFSDPSLAALKLAFSLARESGAVLTLLHVVEWPWHEPPPPVLDELPAEQGAALAEYRRYVETSATERLEALLPDAPRDRSTPRTRLVHGKPYVEILRIAAADSVDLIVMGVHGRNAFDMMLFGSTTNHVVRGATCPVLTLRQ
jgi:nucleotide-binding universal stress UspA family protein